MSTVEHDLREFIVGNFLFGDEARAPGPDDSFIEMGLIDSTGVLELVEFLETRFGFKIPDVELVPENLDSVSAIVAFVQRKTGRQ